MKPILTFRLSIVLAISQFVLSAEGPCERIGDYLFGWTGTHTYTAKTCFMHESSTISALVFQLSSDYDRTVDALYYAYNMKIEYLPENVNEKFPGLKVLVANSCSIKAVTKKNFRNLSKLQLLDLSRNKIEEIYSNTFEDLRSLEDLRLHYNQIKSLSGRAFNNLHSLKIVFLEVNQCIDEKFDADKFPEMHRIITDKCGACASTSDFSVCEISSQISEVLAAVKSLQADNRPQLDSQSKSAKITQITKKIEAFGG